MRELERGLRKSPYVKDIECIGERKHKILYAMDGNGDTGQKLHTVYKEECWEFQAVLGMPSMPWSIEALLFVSLDQPT